MTDIPPTEDDLRTLNVYTVWPADVARGARCVVCEAVLPEGCEVVSLPYSLRSDFFDLAHPACAVRWGHSVWYRA